MEGGKEGIKERKAKQTIFLVQCFVQEWANDHKYSVMLFYRNSPPAVVREFLNVLYFLKL